MPAKGRAPRSPVLADSPGVLIDLDDTLFDHTGVCQAALRAVRAASPELQPLRAEQVWTTYSRLLEARHEDIVRGRLSIDEARRARFEAIAAEAGHPIDPARATRMVEMYQRRYRELRRPVAGARQLLEYLHARGPVAVVTNSRTDEQVEKLAFLGFTPLVDALVVSEAAGKSKPDPEIFRIALERISTPPERAVMIGDSWENDVVGARNAGVRPIWFNRFGADPPRAASGSPVAQIRSLRPASSVHSHVLRQRSG